MSTHRTWAGAAAQQQQAAGFALHNKPSAASWRNLVQTSAGTEPHCWHLPHIPGALRYSDTQLIWKHLLTSYFIIQYWVKLENRSSPMVGVFNLSALLRYCGESNGQEDSWRLEWKDLSSNFLDFQGGGIQGTVPGLLTWCWDRSSCWEWALSSHQAAVLWCFQHALRAEVALLSLTTH